jgi:chromosome segregation ATPase
MLVQGKKDVTLRRMLRDSIDDQVTMFELFTNVKEVADGDAEIVAGVDACMKHWAAMSREYQGKEAALMSNMRKLQDTCKLNVDGFNEGLLRMRRFAKDRQVIQELCGDALAGLKSGMNEVVSLGEQVAQTRAHILAKAQMRIRREREVALETAQSEIAAHKRKAEAQRNELADSQRDMARQLEECRAQQQIESNKLCEMLAGVKAQASQVTSMQGELAAKQAEIQELRKDLSGLSKRDAQLEASLGEKQAHINKLLSGTRFRDWFKLRAAGFRAKHSSSVSLAAFN